MAMTIEDLSRRTGVPVKTLRKYEDLGLEGLWYLRKGTNVIVRTTRGADPRGSVDQ
jgi:hypothetical protein